MKIEIDGTIFAIQPSDLRWTPPDVVARDGNFAPIRGAYWECQLSLGINVEPVLEDWFALFDASSHTAKLPHPSSGVMTSFSCYVDSFAPNMDTSGDCAKVTGFDVTLTGIVVV